MISLSFIAATFFHGASAVGLLVFLLILTLENIKKTFKLLLNKKANLKTLMIMILSLTIILSYMSNKFDIPYIEGFKQATSTENLKFIINTKVRVKHLILNGLK